MKYVFLLAAFLYLGSLLPAGGSQESESRDSVQTITLWRHLDNPEDGNFDVLIDKFNEEYAGRFEVIFELVPWNGAHDKYVTALVAGTGADVIYLPTVWGSEFWDMGVLEPLNQYVDSWDGRERIADIMWNESTIDEQIFGIPITSILTYMYYRQDWFDELNLSVPETREELLEASLRITERIDGAYGFAMRGARGGTSMWNNFVLPAVGGVWFDENGNSTFRTPEAKEANEWYVNLYREHGVVPPTAPTDGFSEIIGNFKAGVTGILFHHLMSSVSLTDALGEDRVGVAIVPSVHGNRYTDAGLAHYVMNRNSENKDAAWAFMSFMSRPDNQAFEAKTLGSVPITQGVEEYDPIFEENRFFRASIESIPFGQNPPSIETYGIYAEREWPRTFQRALLGEITPDEMMDHLADVLEGR